MTFDKEEWTFRSQQDLIAEITKLRLEREGLGSARVNALQNGCDPITDYHYETAAEVTDAWIKRYLTYCTHYQADGLSAVEQFNFNPRTLDQYPKYQCTVCQKGFDDNPHSTRRW
jgi:hypothetical protein